MHYVREGNEYTVPGCGGIDREMHKVFNVPRRQADKLYVVACVSCNVSRLTFQLKGTVV